MRRTCSVLLALVLALCPAVWAREMAAYPGWVGEVALRGAGCTSVSARLSGWTALPETTDAAGAAALVEQLATRLGFSGTLLTTPNLALINGTRAGAAASVQANLRDSLWLLTVELTCSTHGAAWYALLRDALNTTGSPGALHVSVLGLKPGRLEPVAMNFLTRTICGSLLAGVANTVTDGSGGRVVSGYAGLIPRQSGFAGPGGSFALALNFSEDQQATIITVGVPGLR